MGLEQLVITEPLGSERSYKLGKFAIIDTKRGSASWLNKFSGVIPNSEGKEPKFHRFLVIANGEHCTLSSCQGQCHPFCEGTTDTITQSGRE